MFCSRSYAATQRHKVFSFYAFAYEAGFRIFFRKCLGNWIFMCTFAA